LEGHHDLARTTSRGSRGCRQDVVASPAKTSAVSAAKKAAAAARTADIPNCWSDPLVGAPGATMTVVTQTPSNHKGLCTDYTASVAKGVPVG